SRPVARAAQAGGRQSRRRIHSPGLARFQTTMSKQAQRRAFRVFLGTILALFIAAGIVAWQVYRFPDTPQGSGAQTAVVIPKGATLNGVVAALEHAGVVTRPTLFRLYANHRGVA